MTALDIPGIVLSVNLKQQGAAVTQLNQIIAIEQGVRDTVNREFNDAYHTIQKSAPLHGISRTYEPKNDDGETLPPESTKVQITTTNVIQAVEHALTRLFNVTFTKDMANTQAVADVVVDGNTLIAAVPVPFLLFLQKHITDLRTFITKLPVLDPSEDWEFDPNTGAYRSMPKSTIKTQKVPKVLVKYDATEKHPAQTEVYNEDVPVGTWTTIKFSGALPQTSVTTMLERVDAVIEAVKKAREFANTLVITDQDASPILSYIFGGAATS